MITSTTNNAMSKRELRSFGLIMAVMFALFFGLLIPWVWNLNYPRWPWWVGGVFLASALVSPVVLKPVYGLWMKIAHVLGWINTRLLLALVFYAIIFPIGLCFRVLGKDPLVKKFDISAASYRKQSKSPAVENLEKPF